MAKRTLTANEFVSGCRLNRKPYTDRHGIFRQRMECCGNPGDGCSAAEHSRGVELDDIQRMRKMSKEAKVSLNKQYGRLS